LNELDRLLSVLRLQDVDRVPCICPMQTGTIALMKESGAFWPDAHHDPEKMARLAFAANRYAGIESIRVPFEVSVDASAFGAATKDRALVRRPQILERTIKGREGFEEVELPDPQKDGMVPVVLKAIRLLKQRAPTLPVICGVVAPHMLAIELLGEQEATRLMTDDPMLFRATLHKTKLWAIAHATAAADAGADVIALVDSYASADFLPPELYREYALPFHRRVCFELEKIGVPVILHICGDASANLPLMAETGACGISIDYEVDVKEAKRVLIGKSAVIGNLSPTEVLLRASVEEIAVKTKDCISSGVDAVSPGCGLAIETPLQKLKAMVDATKRFGTRAADR
jgi:[methyl-Co(III) methanol-specific corrinoid protein]:coenzyme M methyltransferase